MRKSGRGAVWHFFQELKSNLVAVRTLPFPGIAPGLLRDPQTPFGIGGGSVQARILKYPFAGCAVASDGQDGLSSFNLALGGQQTDRLFGFAFVRIERTTLRLRSTAPARRPVFNGDGAVTRSTSACLTATEPSVENGSRSIPYSTRFVPFGWKIARFGLLLRAWQIGIMERRSLARRRE